MACVRTSSNVTTSPPRIGSLSGVPLLGPILPEPPLELYAGKHARCDKAVRPASIARDTLPHRVRAPHDGCYIGIALSPRCPPSGVPPKREGLLHPYKLTYTSYWYAGACVRNLALSWSRYLDRGDARVASLCPLRRIEERMPCLPP